MKLKCDEKLIVALIQRVKVQSTCCTTKHIRWITAHTHTDIFTHLLKKKKKTKRQNLHTNPFNRFWRTSLQKTKKKRNNKWQRKNELKWKTLNKITFLLLYLSKWNSKTTTRPNHSLELHLQTAVIYLEKCKCVAFCPSVSYNNHLTFNNSNIFPFNFASSLFFLQLQYNILHYLYLSFPL